MLNKLPVESEARQPRGVVKVNDVPVSGWTEFEVDNNTFYQADTFRVVFAMSDLPAQFGPDWFSSQLEITVEIFAGFPANPDSYTASDLQSLIYGKADTMSFDPAGRTIELSGRDLTLEMIDTKTTEKWPNLTASEIATQIAQRHDLTPVVTKTSKKAGTFYEIDYARLSDERTEWDLLTFLAHSEMFTVYVKGRELHFKPKPNKNDNPYVLKWEPPTDARGFYNFNGKSMHFTRDLTLARGVTVLVRSFNAKTKQNLDVTYPKRAKGTAPGRSSPKYQTYVFIIPGLTPEEALQRAQAEHRAISQHEVKLTANLPADNILQTQNVIKVVGTGTGFDQIYYPDSITRRMSMSDGYSMAVTAKNTSPENDVTI